MNIRDALIRDGYAIVRAVYDAADIEALGEAADDMLDRARAHPTSYRHGNTLYAIGPGRNVRFIHWPAYEHEVLESYRRDPRQLALVEAVTGPTVKQIANQLVWKRPLDPDTKFGWHQDARFRRPADAFRDLATSYVQVMIAIDPHTEESGCVQVVRGSHRSQQLLPLPVDRPVVQETSARTALAQWGLDAGDCVPLLLEPGDVGLWLPHTVHASGPNRSERDRRAYTNGYIRADRCDRGAPAFQDGEPVPLGEPVLIQYDDLFTRPEPHYVDGAYYPVPPANGK